MVLLAQLAAMAIQVKMVRWDHLVLLVRQVLLANLDATAPAEIPVEMLKVTIQFLANVDPTASLVSKVRRDLTARLVRMANRGSLDHAARLVPPVRMAKTATLATKDPLVRQANQESGVFARNIALWTAAFSSKMAQGDKTAAWRTLYTAAGNISFHVYLICLAIVLDFASKAVVIIRDAIFLVHRCSS